MQKSIIQVCLLHKMYIWTYLPRPEIRLVENICRCLNYLLEIYYKGNGKISIILYYKKYDLSLGILITLHRIIKRESKN